MRIVPIECVKDGCCLGKTIFDNDGRVLLREGVRLNSKLLKRVQNLGIYSIYITDEYSEKEIEDIIKPEIRQKCIKVIKDTFSNIHNYVSNSISPKVSSNDIKKSVSYSSSIKEVAEDLLDEVLGRKNIMINLVDIKSMDNYTYQHCVNVSIIALIIGTQLKLRKSELLDLCVGSLLHDIGKVFIPKEILNKKGLLTSKEFQIIKTHSNKGYEYLKGNLEISPPARVVVLQHHEKINGTGYPDGRHGDEITKLSKITAVADVYDALTSDRPYRRAMSPNEALEYIFANGGTHFDYETVRAFSSVIIPYPEGTIVELNNGDIGVVEEICPYYPLRPKLKLIKTKDEGDKYRKGTFIDLVEELNLVIQRVVYEI
ncbi:HD-GYP domain-containing protein [Clostridium sp.]|jgi:HD-GYP domain-containing protein (c-di-GMP phosphodiesterase class II)|uniref:HD-GYP domain-containing protein n=1 Tax=Clostridium sp. TaxID=1506 RepID=UPI0039F5A8AF